MAYVAARRNGRFEIRESVHTARGPRARSLAGFAVLSDEVLARAARRAGRPFDVPSVIASGRRAGARVTAGAQTSAAEFVQASRRMARSLQRAPSPGRPVDPGDALIDLLGFADAVAASQPPRPRQSLRFPALAPMAASRPVASQRGSRRETPPAPPRRTRRHTVAPAGA
ncbi:MAG TPA: hypothetical protein VMU32_00295 [Solirubrobacteraceae bacterium]|nr:hypothetical protein [Solirubrobacteraceae bacterium]